MAGMNKMHTNSGMGANNNKTIGANEDMFLKAFDSTPKLNIVTHKKLENELARCISIISKQDADWDNRVKAMKLFRSLVNSGISDHEDFYTTTLKNLEIPFQNNICDLRSQVVRETCITIAFLSCRLQQKFSRMAECLLPSLIKIIPNSAKIISTSAFVALRFIIQSTHNSRLIPIIKYQLSTSKAKDIHRALCEIAERIVTIWPPHIIERHINDFQEVLRLGICDSDEMARQYSRRAFNVFAEHFREHADKLFNSLDQQRQRMLNNLNHGGGSTLSMNGYGSATSGLNTIGMSGHLPAPTPISSIPSVISSSISSSNFSSHSPLTSTANHHRANHQHFSQNYQNSPSSGYGQQYGGNTNNINIVSRLKSSLISSNGTSSLIASSIPKSSPNYQHHQQLVTPSPSRIRTPTARSTSAIDVDAQQRARARAVYLSSMYHRPRQLAGDVTPSPMKSQLPQPTANAANNGAALSKAAAYLSSVISNNNIAESQIVTTIKYFHSLIDKHSSEIIRQLLPELMPPLAIGADNSAISVRKVSVFAMVAIYAKVGLHEMETYLTSLTMTQRKLLEVYIKKQDEETKSKQQMGESLDSKNFSSSTTSNISS